MNITQARTVDQLDSNYWRETFVEFRNEIRKLLWDNGVRLDTIASDIEILDAIEDAIKSAPVKD